jgi:hypothetical protein
MVAPFDSVTTAHGDAVFVTAIENDADLKRFVGGAVREVGRVLSKVARKAARLVVSDRRVLGFGRPDGPVWTHDSDFGRM